MAVLNYIIAAAGGLVGGVAGVMLPTVISKKVGFTVKSVLEKKDEKDEEVEVDEEGNPIVKAVEVASEPIFHAVKEDEPKSPFKKQPKKAAEKNVNGVEVTESTENK